MGVLPHPPRLPNPKHRATMPRIPTSKKLRFDVFKRDGFVCQYCGRHPPNVILEADHLSPVVVGGETALDNLVTACFDCNRGKGKTPLSVVPQSLADKAAEIQEREAQLIGFRKIIEARFRRKKRNCLRVAEALCPGADSFRKDWFSSIRNFLEILDFHDVLESAESANRKIPYSEVRRFRYFCGICWNKSRQGQAQANG